MTKLSTDVAEQTESTIVNFLDYTNKTRDWRYKKFQHLLTSQDQHSKQTTAHWMGLIKLDHISTHKTYCRVFFFNGNDFESDSAVLRHEDGAVKKSDSPHEYLYEFQEILPQLIEAKKSGKKYFQILVEESVDVHGTHHVYLLYRKIKGISVYGIESDLPWIEQLARKWNSFSSVNLDVLEKICILSHNAYDWHK